MAPAARKHVMDEAIAGRPEPAEGEAVVKVVQADGGYIYRVQVLGITIAARFCLFNALSVSDFPWSDGTRSHFSWASSIKVSETAVGQTRFAHTMTGAATDSLPLVLLSRDLCHLRGARDRGGHRESGETARGNDACALQRPDKAPPRGELVVHNNNAPTDGPCT